MAVQSKWTISHLLGLKAIESANSIPWKYFLCHSVCGGFDHNMPMIIMMALMLLETKKTFIHFLNSGQTKLFVVMLLLLMTKKDMMMMLMMLMLVETKRENLHPLSEFGTDKC